MHFHGTNTSPQCHSDEVIHTLIDSGESFPYTIEIPPTSRRVSTGIIRMSTALAVAVLGGATGAIEVEGIANIQPAVSGLPERMLVRPRSRGASSGPASAARRSAMPFWDVSLNYVPVDYPMYKPAIIQTRPAKRSSGASPMRRRTRCSISRSNTTRPQPLQVVAFDGVPTGSQDGKRQGTIVTEQDILMPPGGTRRVHRHRARRQSEDRAVLRPRPSTPARSATRRPAAGDHPDRDGAARPAARRCRTVPPTSSASTISTSQGDRAPQLYFSETFGPRCMTAATSAAASA